MMEKYTRDEMLAWARHYQIVSRQYYERGDLETAARQSARGRAFLYAVIEGRAFFK